MDVVIEGSRDATGSVYRTTVYIYTGVHTPPAMDADPMGETAPDSSPSTFERVLGEIDR